MTYAPASITELATYWRRQGGTNLGIVGDVSHANKGVSYHLGKRQLAPDAYSRQTPRDRQGLSEAASAIDLGKLNGTLGRLRTFSVWLVAQCRANAPITSDVREVIYTADGVHILRWDRERGVASLPKAGEADTTHLWHTHISFYRDSRLRSKVGLFSPYFALPDTSTEDVVVIVVTVEKMAPQAFTSAVPKLRRFTATDELDPIDGPYSSTVDARVSIDSPGVPHGSGFLRLAAGGSKGKYILASEVTLN